MNLIYLIIFTTLIFTIFGISNSLVTSDKVQINSPLKDYEDSIKAARSTFYELVTRLEQDEEFMQSLTTDRRILKREIEVRAKDVSISVNSPLLNSWRYFYVYDYNKKRYIFLFTSGAKTANQDLSTFDLMSGLVFASNNFIAVKDGFGNTINISNKFSKQITIGSYAMWFYAK